MSRSLDKLFRGVEILMAVFLAIMIALFFMNVVLRYLFSTGFAWSEEIARLCFIYLVYLGTIGAYRDNRHLGVETLINRASPGVQKVLYAAIQLIVIWLMALLTIGSWELAVQNLGDRWVATQYPRALVYGIGVVTGVSIILVAAANLYRLLVQKLSVAELMKIRDADADESYATELD